MLGGFQSPKETTKLELITYFGDSNKGDSKHHTSMNSTRQATEDTSNWMDYFFQQNDNYPTHRNNIVDLWPAVIRLQDQKK
jgi:hypothetical protein